MIEENILKGKIDFKKKISKEARSAIKIMLDPDPKKRPYAKDLLKLEFFGTGLVDPSQNYKSL